MTKKIILTLLSVFTLGALIVSVLYWFTKEKGSVDDYLDKWYDYE